MNIWQRAKCVFSETAFEKYISDFVSGADLTTFGNGADEQTALKYSVFFACARVIAETFASVNIQEYKRLDNGDKEKTNDTGVLPILKFAPNDETSAYNFQEALAYQIVLGGNFYAERLLEGRKLVGLYQADYKNVDVYRDSRDRRITYRFSNYEEGGHTILKRPDVLHIPGPSTNGITGMSALQYGASAIRLGATYEKFGQKFYDNGAAPSGVFEHPRFLKEEAYNRLSKKIKKDWTGLDRVGTPILSEDGLVFKQISIKPIDAELLSSKEFQIEDVCRYMRVAPHLVQHLKKSTFNNIEQQSLEHVMYTMLPYYKRAEANINSQLLTPQQLAEGYFFEYNISTLLRGDQKAMSEAFAKGRQWGWLSVNDVRRMLNLNSVAGGDEYLRPLNMAPIGEEEGATGDPASVLIGPLKKPNRGGDGNNGKKINVEIVELMEKAKL